MQTSLPSRLAAFVLAALFVATAWTQVLTIPAAPSHSAALFAVA